MITVKDHKQTQLFDPWQHLSPKRRRMLDNSWAGLFKKHLLDELPVKDFSAGFTTDVGRPCKELHSVLGALVLQQTFDLTDLETVDQFSFNILWHYALNITEESDAAKYISLKTLWSMRSLAIKTGLDELLFNNLTDKLAKVFKVDVDYQRLDSVHIRSNMQRLGRIRIFAKTIHKFLLNLKRRNLKLFNSINTDLVDRYFSDRALKCFAMVKPSGAQKTLLQVAKDLFTLTEQFKALDDVIGMHSYKLMCRVLREQCDLNPSDQQNPIAIKPADKVNADSLQNPSDPQASFSSHKGQGYQVQVMESFSTTENKEEKARTLNLITHVSVEKASQSDAKALKEAIRSSDKRALKPEKLTADAAYGSDDNYQTATTNGVELIAPVAGNKEHRSMSLSAFTFTPAGHVKHCPEGHQPLVRKKKKQRYSQGFETETCSSCPLVDQCPVRPGKKYYYLRYYEKAMRTARRRAHQASEDFKSQYRWRAGVEATMSELDRRTGIKSLRVRGFKPVRFYATLKTAGLNLLRAASVHRAMAT